MGVYKRKLAKGIRWYFSGQYKGLKYFSKAIYFTRAECLMAERDKLAELERNLDNPQNEMLLSEVMNARLDEIKSNRSNTYYRENQRYFKMLIGYVGNVPIMDVKKAQMNALFQKYSNQLNSQKHSNHGANSMLRVLKALFNYAIRIYDIDIRNPCVGINLLPIDIKLKYIPTDMEVTLVRESLDKSERDLFNFVEQTGCRINEALKLKYEDITEGLVTLWTHKAKNSNLTPRSIPVPGCLAGKKGKGRVFDRWDNQPRFLEKHIGKLGIKKWSWHNLRHRRASLWAQEGRNLLEIMQLLGHSNLSTTQKYLQILGHIKL